MTHACRQTKYLGQVKDGLGYGYGWEWGLVVGWSELCIPLDPMGTFAGVKICLAGLITGSA